MAVSLSNAARAARSSKAGDRPSRSCLRDALWLLTMRDHLDQAQAHAPYPDPDHASGLWPQYPWLADLARARNLVEEALTGIDVEPCARPGEPFDPARHEAVGHDDYPIGLESRVQRVVTQGFRLGPTVLRKAQVSTVP
jgi:molecular chaperone GrpE (heat shock protein)